jgi:hypothetical protein
MYLIVSCAHSCSVVEEELRSIAREVRRQQAPRRPAIPLPRAASRAPPAPLPAPGGGGGEAAALRRRPSSSGSRGLALPRQRSGSVPPAAVARSHCGEQLQGQSSGSSFAIGLQHPRSAEAGQGPAADAAAAPPLEAPLQADRGLDGESNAQQAQLASDPQQQASFSPAAAMRGGQQADGGGPEEP